jgi:hypothetical protein
VFSAVEAGGFAVTPVGCRYVEGMPRWAGWTEWGVATKS